MGGLYAQGNRRQPADLLAVRERDKWHFIPPDGESYQQVAARMRGWYLGLERDAVVVSHGGALRTLMVALGIETPDTAPATDIVQGAVYHLAGRSMTCHR